MLALSAAPVRFDIPAQSAPAALQLFIQQSACEVLFPYDELKDTKTNAVQGEFEPEVAMARLLAGTGYTAVPQGDRKLLVKPVDKPKTATGMIKGVLTWPDGAPAEGIQVFIRETGQSAPTNRYGQYVFPEVPAGTFLLIAQAEGYQPLHLTDVTVKANSELILSKQAMRKADEVTKLEPYAVHAESVTELDPYAVTSNKEKPFQGANVDIPRTIDDAQPYYVFDSVTLERSGAPNIEDFLRQSLTMNGSAISNSQSVSAKGNVSSINLRGLGDNKTLILVNGRRLPVDALSSNTLTNNQPDLNGIPLSAVERIEVLPTSASGIYGGSAIGGVVNIVLKTNYSGGELRTTYSNAWDSDVSGRTVSLTYGLGLEGGRTHLTFTASHSDENVLELGDRAALIDRYVQQIWRNSPVFFTTGTGTPIFVGALPNIVNAVLVNGVPAPLVLKSPDGRSLGSGYTFVPAGTSTSTPFATLANGLFANAGKLSLDLPDTAQTPAGRRQALSVTPTTDAIMLSATRKMRPGLELFLDLSGTQTRTENAYYQLPTTIKVNPGSRNPFTTAVNVTIPSDYAPPVTTKLRSYRTTIGMKLQLPHQWLAQADYTWSRSRYDYRYVIVDPAAFLLDGLFGIINPFADPGINPVNMLPYASSYSNWFGISTLNDVALRGSGPLFALPWGTPNLTVGLERRIAARAQNAKDTVYDSVSAQLSQRFVNFGRRQVTDSVYLESLVPLVPKQRFSWVHSLDLQLAGRAELYAVDAGTPSYSQDLTTGEVTYTSPTTATGQPFKAIARYSSSNGSVGFKYQPVETVTVRVSLATAFLPSTPDQLTDTPQVDSALTTITDPTNQASYGVSVRTGGNANLRPQNSKSWNAGLIWEPRAAAVKGLRLNIEYYRIDQYNAITSLSAQQIIDNAQYFPGRVTRDASGKISLVDATFVNLFLRRSEGWDFSASYERKTSAGTFTLQAAESIILHLQNQQAASGPLLEAVNSPSEGGAVKYNSNGNLRWQLRNWNAGWSTRYVGSYRQYGAPGGPSATSSGTPGALGYLAAQGGPSIPSQIYHDLYVGYDFGKVPRDRTTQWARLRTFLLNDVSLSVGVKNVFDKAPPLDVAYPYYASPYGNLRLRNYWISLKKAF